VLPFTELSNDVIRLRQRVKEGRSEVEVRTIPTDTAIPLTPLIQRQFKRSQTVGAFPGDSGRCSSCSEFLSWLCLTVSQMKMETPFR